MNGRPRQKLGSGPPLGRKSAGSCNTVDGVGQQLERCEPAGAGAIGGRGAFEI